MSALIELAARKENEFSLSNVTLVFQLVFHSTIDANISLFCSIKVEVLAFFLRN